MRAFAENLKAAESTQFAVQPTLTIDAPGSGQEKAANDMAHQVMRKPVGEAELACPCGGGCPPCQQKQLQRQTSSRAGSHNIDMHAASPGIQRLTAAPGQRLDSTTRNFFESRFGRDFGQVRIHTDVASAATARQINAQAYTLNNHIVFADTAYQPDTYAGRQLLAHELAHVVQQSSGQTKADAKAGTNVRANTRVEANSETATIQRQPAVTNAESNTASDLSQARREELRQLARRPGRLAELWNRLSGDEQLRSHFSDGRGLWARLC